MSQEHSFYLEYNFKLQTWLDIESYTKEASLQEILIDDVINLAVSILLQRCISTYVTKWKKFGQDSNLLAYLVESEFF